MAIDDAISSADTLVQQIIAVFLALFQEFLDVDNGLGPFLDIFITIFDNAQMQQAIFLLILGGGAIVYLKKPDTLEEVRLWFKEQRTILAIFF